MSVSHQKKAANGRLFYSILISRFFLIGLSLGALGVLGEINKKSLAKNAKSAKVAQLLLKAVVPL